LEKERYDNLLPVVAGTDLKVVALCMSDKGMPKTTEERMQIADKLVNGLLQNNISVENIYVDPLVQPIATEKSFGVEFLNAIEQIVATFKGIHTMCGLSNISYGLPKRPFLNQTFMSMAIAKGLNGAIINPLDKKMVASIIAATALAGKDDFCMEYITAYRANRLEF
jgi:cobalamin-dependent methionine synthase I